MVKSVWVFVVAVGLIVVIGVPNSFAQFGGRGGLGGLFGGTSRGGRGNTKTAGIVFLDPSLIPTNKPSIASRSWKQIFT
jgi:hypothetical protein